MVPAFPSEVGLPNYPQSHPIPQVRSTRPSLELGQSGNSAQPENVPNMGIDACYLRLLSIWGHAMTFLQFVKDNEYPAVWSETGPYQKIVAELYDFETSIGHAYRLRNARLDERSSADLEIHRGYWAPWLTMQLLCHSLQVLIHHPFLHLAKRRTEHTMRPPSFSQRTVDQMLLHSGWVTNFLIFCDERSFEINDPFIAHLASIIATGYLFFLTASNTDLVQQANRGFDTCYRFVKRSAAVWAHLKNTVSRGQLSWQ
jgi:hypothetical protein